MFVREEVRLAAAFSVARNGLTGMSSGNWLLNASQAAYGDGITGTVRVGPPGAWPRVSKLVKVQVGDVAARDDSVSLPLRWEATGAGSGLFPALDADITLTPAGQDSTLLTLAGVYRPPLGSLGTMLDRALLSRIAAATVREFLGRLAVALVDPSGAAHLGMDAGSR